MCVFKVQSGSSHENWNFTDQLEQEKDKKIMKLHLYAYRQT